MRIAVFIEAPPAFAGAFQQSLSTTKALLASPALAGHEWLVFTPSKDAREALLTHGIEAVLYRQPVFRILDRLSATPLGGAILRRLRRLGFPRLGRHLDAVLTDHGIDFVFLNQCADAGLRIGDHPFAVVVWDTDQYDHPECPESYRHRLFERTDQQMWPTLRRAVAVIANTEVGARRIAGLFNLDPKRMLVFPFLPTEVVRRHASASASLSGIDEAKHYGLPERYVFYPASFLPHKNHLYLLEALGDLEKRHGITLGAVLSRGDGELDVRKHVERLGLSGRIAFVGWVPDEHMPALYRRAVALVVPSYFGPTNLPPVEAIALGCPVICTDDPANREQLGDAALYCRLEDPSTLADQLAALVRDETLRDNLTAGRSRLALRLSKIDYGEILAPVLRDFEYKRRGWAGLTIK